MNESNLSRDEADLKGYAVFNNCRHICLNYDDERSHSGMLTVSVRIPGGRHVTLCIIGDKEGKKIECADVQLHGSPEQYEHMKDGSGQSLDDGRPRFAQRAIMFGPGYGDNRLRKTSKFSSHIYGTLLTLLINPAHYNKPDHKE